MCCVAVDYGFGDNKTGDSMEKEELEKLFSITKEQLADRIRDLRHENNYTQEDLEDISGISRRGIGYIEGAEVDIKLSTLLKLSESFRITLAEKLNCSDMESSIK